MNNNKSVKNSSSKFKVLSKPLIILGIVAFAIFVFLLIEQTKSPKNKVVKKVETEVNCSPEADTISYLKSKIVKLLSEAHLISQNSKNKEVSCIKALLPDADYLIIESTEAGENYHKLEQYLAKDNGRAFVLDTIKTEIKNKVLKFKIYGKSIEPIAQTYVTTNTNTNAKESFRLPKAFQGKIKGKTRRLNIISQISNGNKIEFSYSVLGSYTDQNKKGTVDTETGDVNFESLGKAKITINKDSFIIKIESENTEIISINQ